MCKEWEKGIIRHSFSVLIKRILKISFEEQFKWIYLDL